MIKKIIISILCVMCVLLPLQACKENPTDVDSQKNQVTYTEYFDTTATFTADASQKDFEAMCDIVSSNLSEYHKLLNVYETYEGVINLKVINDVAPVKVEASKKLIDFLDWAIEAHHITDGYTSITAGAITELWHENRNMQEIYNTAPVPPTEGELLEAKNHIDIDSLVIDKEACTVYLSDPAAALDATYLAKGYVADVIYDELIAEGYTNFIISIGGISKVSGTNKNAKIAHPDNAEEPLCTIEITDTSLVTNETYKNFFLYGTTKCHTIINPFTAMPEQTFVSVSVLCESAALADALSNALFSMTAEEGSQLVNYIGDVEVVWMYDDADRTVEFTPAFADILYDYIEG